MVTPAVAGGVNPGLLARGNTDEVKARVRWRPEFLKNRLPYEKGALFLHVSDCLALSLISSTFLTL